MTHNNPLRLRHFLKSIGSWIEDDFLSIYQIVRLLQIFAYINRFQLLSPLTFSASRCIRLSWISGTKFLYINIYPDYIEWGNKNYNFNLKSGRGPMVELESEFLFQIPKLAR